MSLISITDYLAIATSYADARDTVLAAKDHLLAAVNTIVQIDEIQPEVDLLNVFWDTYNLNVDQLGAVTLLLSAVRALNNHVLIQGGYSNLDEYFADNSIEATGNVPASWAELCTAAGYSISNVYIA